MTRIAINGFGRIGRNVLRALLERDTDLEIVAVNDLTEPATLARLLAYDTTAGRLGRPVTVDGDTLVVDGRRIKVLAEREPADLPWAELGVDLVLEATGRFTSAKAARAHLDAGARKVLVSAPSDGADVTLAFGVNTDAYDPAVHTIVSNASCTTNALAPLAAVLDELAGIEHGFMTTVHAYTQEQNLQDGPHRDARRARAARSHRADHDRRRQGDRPRTAEPGRQALGRLDPRTGAGGLDRRTQHHRHPRRDPRGRAGAYRTAPRDPLRASWSTPTTRSSPPTSRATRPRRSSTPPSPASTAAT